MKFLRLIYLIIAGIILLPIIFIIEIIGFIWILIDQLILKYKYKEPIGNCIINSVKYWIAYVKLGLEMNYDFIQNGLKPIVTFINNKNESE